MENKNTNLSRRELIKTGVAAAAVGVPTFIPEGVLARNGKQGANDRIVYAHIGVGGMGSSHIVPDAAALCDVDENHLKAAAKRVTEGTPKLYKDFREILDRKDIDAVTIGTPDHWHAIMSVMACQSGKDVYSEKPTCKTIQEGQAMINAARANKRVVQIGAQGRSNPNAWAACQYIRNGQIGKVKNVEVWHPNNYSSPTWGEDKAAPSELDWNLWLGPARWRDYNPAICHFHFRWMMDYGAGFIRDRGNHVLSVVMWCLGADNQGPVSVEATGYRHKDSVYDSPYSMNVTWEFKNPDWTLTWGQPGEPKAFPGRKNPIDWGALYTGDRGTLLVANGDGGCETEAKAREYEPDKGGFVPYLEPDFVDPTERHRRNWRRCIKTRENPAMDVEIGVNVITLPIIANVSYLLGRKLRWDHENKRFKDDEEANRFLAQTYRAPWHL